MKTFDGTYDETVDEFIFHGKCDDGVYQLRVSKRAIATRMELLGYKDPVDALAAIVIERVQPPVPNHYEALMRAYSDDAVDTEEVRAKVREGVHAPEPTPRSVNSLAGVIPNTAKTGQTPIVERLRALYDYFALEGQAFAETLSGPTEPPGS